MKVKKFIVIDTAFKVHYSASVQKFLCEQSQRELAQQVSGALNSKGFQTVVREVM